MSSYKDQIETTIAFLEYEMIGGPEGIDEYVYYTTERYIPDEDGEIAYEAMMDRWASQEQETEDRAMGIW